MPKENCGAAAAARDFPKFSSCRVAYTGTAAQLLNPFAAAVCVRPRCGGL